MPLAVLLLYGAAGTLGGAVPVHPGWQQTAGGIRIHVEDNGIHTGIVVPKVAGGIDLRDLARPGDLRDPRHGGHDHLSFGWGDRAFYVETPTWADVRPGTVLRAAFGSDTTVMHVAHMPNPEGARGVRSVTVSTDEYRRLAAVIRQSFRVPPGGRTVPIPGYGAADVFYEANGRYSGLRTCNAWTGEALARAGIRIGAWTPFAFTVMQWLPDPRPRSGRIDRQAAESAVFPSGINRSVAWAQDGVRVVVQKPE